MNLMVTWRNQHGATRLDRDLDGKIDAPGAAVLDEAWSGISKAVLAPVLGPLVDRFAALDPPSADANPGGSSYEQGWYGYIDKDLRTLLGRPVRDPYSRHSLNAINLFVQPCFGSGIL